MSVEVRMQSSAFTFFACVSWVRDVLRLFPVVVLGFAWLKPGRLELGAHVLVVVAQPLEIDVLSLVCLMTTPIPKGSRFSSSILMGKVNRSPGSNTNSAGIGSGSLELGGCRASFSSA